MISISIHSNRYCNNNNNCYNNSNRYCTINNNSKGRGRRIRMWILWPPEPQWPVNWGFRNHNCPSCRTFRSMATTIIIIIIISTIPATISWIQVTSVHSWMVWAAVTWQIIWTIACTVCYWMGRPIWVRGRSMFKITTTTTTTTIVIWIKWWVVEVCWVPQVTMICYNNN